MEDFKVVKTITMDYKQAKELKEKGVNLSKFIRWAIKNKLNEYEKSFD